MNHEEMDARRKEFFNSHAEAWLDMFYRNPQSGVLDRHEADFKRLFSIIGLRLGDTVMDVGCGCGVLVPYILDRIGPDGRLYEIDYAEKMIEVNKCLHQDPRITFLNTAVEFIGLPAASIDKAICFACFPHFQRKTESLLEIKRVLKPGGVLIIAHFASADEINHRHGKHECVMHDRLPSEKEMRELLASVGFQIDSFEDEPGFYCIRAENHSAGL